MSFAQFFSQLPWTLRHKTNNRLLIHLQNTDDKYSEEFYFIIMLCSTEKIPNYCYLNWLIWLKLSKSARIIWHTATCDCLECSARVFDPYYQPSAHTLHSRLWFKYDQVKQLSTESKARFECAFCEDKLNFIQMLFRAHPDLGEEAFVFLQLCRIRKLKSGQRAFH